MNIIKALGQKHRFRRIGEFGLAGSFHSDHTRAFLAFTITLDNLIIKMSTTIRRLLLIT